MTLPKTFSMLFFMISFDSGMGTHPNNTLTCSDSYKRTLHTESHLKNISKSFIIFSFFFFFLFASDVNRSASHFCHSSYFSAVKILLIY